MNEKELENAYGYIVNGKLIHFISQRERFGEGCKHRRCKQKNLMADNLNRIPERSDNLSFRWNDAYIQFHLGALLNTCGHTPSKWSSDTRKRPVGHTFTCDEWRLRRRRQCRPSAEQKPRIKIHGIIKFTVRPTWVWSTRKKSGRRRPLVLGQFIRQPTKTEGRKKRKKRNYPSST